jgi:hypothetical protein
MHISKDHFIAAGSSANIPPVKDNSVFNLKKTG